MSDAVVVEADGGSRGNPGPAAYGALLKDAATGEVLAEDGAPIGTATNNVAEYHGLLGGLRLATRFAPGARLEVRMDSQLVVEQMAGRWRVKNPALRALAEEAGALAPPGTSYTWIPRELNAHADRLANEALDGLRDGVSAPNSPPSPEGDPPGGGHVGREVGREVGGDDGGDDGPIATAPPAPASAPTSGWAPAVDPTTLLLVRHGVTALTAAKRFSGGLAGSNPGLVDEGRAQVRATAAWLAPAAARVAVVLASPVRRTRESADVLAARLERPVLEEPGFAEMEFGAWDGLSFAEVGERHRADLDAWLGSLDAPAGGPAGRGESMRQVQSRVLAALREVLERHATQTVVVVSHVTPIKVLVADALRAPLESVYRMELSPASVTAISYYPAFEGHEARASLRLFNARPPGDDVVGVAPVAW